MWLVKRVVWRGLVLNFHMWNKLYTMILKFFFKTVHPFLFQICMLLVLYLSILPPYFCWGDCIFCQPVKVIWNAVSFQTQNEKYFLRTICFFLFYMLSKSHWQMWQFAMKKDCLSLAIQLCTVSRFSSSLSPYLSDSLLHGCSCMHLLSS